MPRGSLPWLLLAGTLAIGLAIFLVSTLVNPVFAEFTALPGWRGSSLSYANEGMRMVGDFVNYLIVVVFLGVAIGVLVDARRRAA